MKEKINSIGLICTILAHRKVLEKQLIMALPREMRVDMPEKIFNIISGLSNDGYHMHDIVGVLRVSEMSRQQRQDLLKRQKEDYLVATKVWKKCGVISRMNIDMFRGADFGVLRIKLRFA
ncbi:MAG: hypothetical protein WC823_02570 [Parcubacteria group bacterium]|jgi:hypothetical protein